MWLDSLIHLASAKPREAPPNAPPGVRLRYELERRLAREPHVCPNCLATDLARMATREFTFFGNKKCCNCACLWTPAWPAWSGIVLVVLGLILTAGPLAGGIVLFIEFIGGNPTRGEQVAPYISAATVAGVLMLWFGWGIVRGTHGHAIVRQTGDQAKHRRLSG